MRRTRAQMRAQAKAQAAPQSRDLLFWSIGIMLSASALAIAWLC